MELFPENICIFVQCFVSIFADEIRDWGKLTHNLCRNMSVPWCFYNQKAFTLSGCVIWSSGSVWVLAFGSSLLLASCWDMKSCCSPLLLFWVFSSNPVSGQIIDEIISHIMTSVWRWHLTAALLQFSDFLSLLSRSAVTVICGSRQPAWLSFPCFPWLGQWQWRMWLSLWFLDFLCVLLGPAANCTLWAAESLTSEWWEEIFPT